MKISEVQEILGAQIVACAENVDVEIKSACGCDMMSDVLAFVKDQSILITGLVNPQVIRTALMMDMKCVVFVRGKKPDEKIIQMAQEHGIIIMTSDLRMYEACGLLYSHGLQAGGLKG
ncbi:MAG: DRTGG domain-containing protein [Clostridia bacterium]